MGGFSRRQSSGSGRGAEIRREAAQAYAWREERKRAERERYEEAVRKHEQWERDRDAALARGEVFEEPEPEIPFI